MTILLATQTPTLLFLGGCVLLTWVLLRRYYIARGSASRRQGPNYLEHVPRPTSAWDGVQKDTLAVVERQKVELQEMARDVNGRVDTKLRLLDQLIVQNQAQIERMEVLLAELKQADRTLSTR